MQCYSPINRGLLTAIALIGLETNALAQGAGPLGPTKTETETPPAADTAAPPPTAAPGAAGAPDAAIPSSNLNNFVAKDKEGWWLLGDGYAQLEQLKTASASLGLGILYIDAKHEIYVTVAKGTSDTTLMSRRDFGQFVLTPNTASIAGTLRVTVFPWANDKVQQSVDHGVGVRAVAGRADWVIPQPCTRPEDGVQSDIGAGTCTLGSVALGASFGYVVRFMGGVPLKSNRISVSAYVGPAVRILAGNVSNSTYRRAAFDGNSHSVFPGFEVAGWLNLNDIELGLSYVDVLALDPDNGVQNLTGGQLFPQLSFRAGVHLQ